jgi:hypothetical protein
MKSGSRVHARGWVAEVDVQRKGIEPRRGLLRESFDERGSDALSTGCFGHRHHHLGNGSSRRVMDERRFMEAPPRGSELLTGAVSSDHDAVVIAWQDRKDLRTASVGQWSVLDGAREARHLDDERLVFSGAAPHFACVGHQSR